MVPSWLTVRIFRCVTMPPVPKIISLQFRWYRCGYGSLVEWYWQGKQKYSGKNLPLSHFLYNNPSTSDFLCKEKYTAALSNKLPARKVLFCLRAHLPPTKGLYQRRDNSVVPPVLIEKNTAAPSPQTSLHEKPTTQNPPQNPKAILKYWKL
jgi:hypothetical protein